MSDDLRTLLRGYVEGESLYDVLSELSPPQLAAVNQLLRPRAHPDATRPGSQQWDELQSDLEQREAALGRALSLLRHAYEPSGPGRDAVVARMGRQSPSPWPDVLRWVADEPKEENVNDETPQVMEVANPAERAAAGVDEGAARWRGFSDEELHDLRAGMAERADGNMAVPVEYRERAERLGDELRREFERREAEQPSYRGPGRYRAAVTGATYEVLGVLGDQVVVRSPMNPDALLAVTRRSFDARPAGERLYEYLGPLTGQARAEIKVVDAGQGWATLEMGGNRLNLRVGDTLDVPALVIS